MGVQVPLSAPTRLYSIKVVHGFGKAETQDRYLLEAPDNARLVKWHNIGFVIRGWEFDSLSGHHFRNFTMIRKHLDLNAVRAFIQSQSPETKVYLGGDSERFQIDGVWYADYINVVVVHKNGKNGCAHSEQLKPRSELNLVATGGFAKRLRLGSNPPSWNVFLADASPNT